ncbi:CHAD domain-containing protein [Oryzifoliimicrobium ureilyticus]|uniref:CHAD domain-containing protein n=1 Tax=Oryzifoliimicrobium ureilyticus TaxID=3113724 RepID=UPI003F67AC72
MDDEHRHQARKDSKKLRYAAEFFCSLYSDEKGQRRHRRFVKAMEELQDQLSELNDLATGPSVIEKYGLEGFSETQDLLSHAKKDDLIKNAQSALDEALDSKRFWR